MSHARRLVVYAGSSWTRIVLSFAVAFFLTPILIGELGLELFGLLSLVSLTLALSDPITSALSKVMTREMAQAKAAGDDARLRRVFSNGAALAVALAAAISVLIGGLVLLAPHIFSLSPENEFRMQAALAVEGLLIATSVLIGPLGTLYIATHRVVLENVHRTIQRVLDLLAALLVFSFQTPDPFLAFVIARSGLRLLQKAIKIAWIYHAEPAARFAMSDLNRTEMKELAGVGAWSISGQLARVGFVTSDQVLLNLFFGLTYNGIYGIVNQLRAYARMFGGNLALGVDTIAADLQERGEDERGRRVLMVTMKMAMSVTVFCAILVGAFAAPLIDVWLGDRLRGDERLAEVMSYDAAITLAWTFILILLPGVVLTETHYAATQNLYGMGYIRRYSPAIITAAILKITVATVWLLMGGGALVLAWSTLLANIAVYGIYFPRLITQLTGLTYRDLLLGVYARPLASGAVCAGVAATLAIELTDWNWTKLILSVGACCLVYAATFPLIVASPNERRSLVKMARGAGRRLARRRTVVRP